jgi:hypothetical protein
MLSDELIVINDVPFSNIVPDFFNVDKWAVFERMGQK